MCIPLHTKVYAFLLRKRKSDQRYVAKTAVCLQSIVKGLGLVTNILFR